MKKTINSFLMVSFSLVISGALSCKKDKTIHLLRKLKQYQDYGKELTKQPSQRMRPLMLKSKEVQMIQKSYAIQKSSIVS